MIDINNILQDLLSLEAENEVVEFKEAKNQYDFNKLGKYFSALSNEANLSGISYAWLVFGIKDSDKSFVNSQFRTNKSDLHSLKSEIANHTTNRISFIEIYEQNIESKRVVLFQIPAAPKGIPVAWKGHYYGRDNEDLGALNLEEIERIRRQVQNEDWSAKLCKNASIEDLSQEAIKMARFNFSKKHPELDKEMISWDDITFLNKAKISIQSKITNTAILLLGKPESEHFISPAISKLSWILKDRDNIEKDYIHVSCPFLLGAELIFFKIRILKYRYLKEGTLFPEEVEQFDPYIIREAINNCIAHQDYQLSGRINVVEYEDGRLVFSNVGSFIPGSVETVIHQDAPQELYRNPFLAQAMVNLGMIDTIGSGIKRMFTIQKDKFFPLPDYDFSQNKVMLTVTGKVLDVEYAKALARNPDLSLTDIMILDKVQKNKTLLDTEIQELKNKKLIEGRKPNFHISSTLAKKTGQKIEYIKQRGIDDKYCQKIIIDYLTKFESAKRTDIEKILLDKLPDVLDEKQKKNKIKNNLQKLRSQDIIMVEGKVWSLSKS